MIDKRPTFGGAVGLGVAAALLVTVIAIGHAIFGQITEAARIMLIFLEVAVCVILAAVVLTGVYVWRANGEFDRLTREIVENAQ